MNSRSSSVLQAMVHIYQARSNTYAPSGPTNHAERQRKALIATIIAVVAAASAVHAAYHGRYSPEPYHNSSLSGEQWTHKLLEGHSDQISDNLGIKAHVFHWLKTELQWNGGLKPRWHVRLDEMLATFLHQCTTNLSTQKVAEQFQHSLETISRCASY